LFDDSITQQSRQAFLANEQHVEFIGIAADDSPDALLIGTEVKAGGGKNRNDLRNAMLLARVLEERHFDVHGVHAFQ
jgi:hypothetical protein